MSETPSDWGRAKLDDVLNTTALIEREPRAPNYAAELDAWVALSQTMGVNPDSMWERMCASLLALIPSASSAGIVLLNPGAHELVQHVCGGLAAALGGRKLRGCNPWRLTVERDAGQLFSRPARHYKWLAKFEPPIYELLTSPMQSHEGRTGVLWVSSDEPDGTFDAEDQRVLARFATLAGSCHALLSRRDRGRERYADLQHREAVRAALFGVLRSDLNPHAVQFEAARIIVDHLMVNRVMYVDVVDDGTTAVIEADYYRDAVSMAGRYPLSEFGAEVLQSLSGGHTLVLDDTHASSVLTESDRTTYEAFGIRSIVAVPLIKNGRLVALLSVHQRTPRTWRATDVALIEEAAERIWAAVTRSRAEAALRDSERSLRDANARLERRVIARTADLAQRADDLRRLAGELTTAEQRERRRLARILHDHLQQVLIAARMKVAMAQARIDDARAREQLLQSAEHLAEAIDQMRSLAAELTPPMLYQAGLMSTLAWLAQRLYADHGLEVTIDADEAAESLSDDFKAFVFQAVRELLLNVVKHAQTHRAAISVQRSAPPGYLEVVVSDQGVGCDAARVLKHPGSGFGLMSIRERLRGLGGAFDLRRGEGNGCRVMLSIPLDDPEGPRVWANGHHRGS